jgi:hypothetical protein
MLFIPLARRMCRSSPLISVNIVCQAHNEVVRIGCMGKRPAFYQPLHHISVKISL